MAAQAVQGRQEGEAPRERVAEIAYELWLKRGCPIGSDQADWFEAEVILKNMTWSDAPPESKPPARETDDTRHRRAKRA